LRQNQIEKAVMKVCDSLDSHRTKIRDWKDYSEEELWFELVSCLLGSRVRYETAKACSTRLRNVGLLAIGPIVESPRRIRNRIRRELNKSIYPPFSKHRGSKYRYPKSRSKYIVRTGLQIYKKEKLTIKEFLGKNKDGNEARKALVEKCCGIGLKQASLFLRNVSFCNDLAILDSHVMRYVELLDLEKEFDDLISEDRNQYLTNENRLKMYAISKRKSLATLDIGIWTVMRVIQRGI
jgi:N-glycosylase/DNA lyase